MLTNGQLGKHLGNDQRYDSSWRNNVM